MSGPNDVLEFRGLCLRAPPGYWERLLCTWEARRASGEVPATDPWSERTLAQCAAVASAAPYEGALRGEVGACITMILPDGVSDAAFVQLKQEMQAIIIIDDIHEKLRGVGHLERILEQVDRMPGSRPANDGE